MRRMRVHHDIRMSLPRVAACEAGFCSAAPLRRLRVQSPFIHDITVASSASMNVVQDSAGFNLNIDHHRCASQRSATRGLPAQEEFTAPSCSCSGCRACRQRARSAKGGLIVAPAATPTARRTAPFSNLFTNLNM